MGNPRSVLHLAAPAAYGGLEQVVAALSIGQTRTLRVHLAALVQDGDESAAGLLDAISAAGVRTHMVRVSARDYRAEIDATRKLCRDLEIDVLHSHGYHADVIATLAGRSLKVARITTLHGFTGGDLRNRAYELLQRGCVRRFDGVVAVSRPMTRSLARWRFPRERLHCIPNACVAPAPEMGRTEARLLLSLPLDGFRFGWVGRLSHEKGCDVALEAFARIHDASVTLSVIGDGPERDRLTGLATRLGIANRVTWHGAVMSAARVFPAFDAFVLSSRTEGTPITLFEAMSAGIAVVATSVGGVPDVIDGSLAILVPPERPDALAAAMSAVLHDGEAATARAAQASARLAAEFGIDTWLSRYDAVYRAALKSRRHT